MKHASIFLVSLVALSTFPGIGAAAEALLDPVAINQRDADKGCHDALDKYLAECVTGFATMDKILADPPEEPATAQADFEEACDPALDYLRRARDAFAAYAGEKGLAPTYEEWFNLQESALQYTRQNGAQAVRLLSIINDYLDTWTNNWVPALREKKKKFRETADGLNAEYHALDKAVKDRGTDAASREKLSRQIEEFKSAVSRAKTLQLALVELKKSLDEAFPQMDPAADLDDIFGRVTADLTVPRIPMPRDRIFAIKHQGWRDLLFQRWKDLLAGFEAVTEACASIRAETLFREQAKPIEGLSYREIHPTFERLYDGFSSVFGEKSKLIKAEEERWDKDRTRIIELVRECGADKEREYLLAIARADNPVEQRAINIEIARMVGPEEYIKLFRRLVADEDLSFEEMKKRETPQFKTAWKEKMDEARAYADDRVKAIESMVDVEQFKLDEFKKLCDEVSKEIGRIIKENGRRRKALGMGPRPFGNG